MQIIKQERILLEHATSKPITYDVNYLDNGIKKPVVVFSHGFKDFKDYGHYNELAEEFAKRGFYFVKLNFSHNGVRSDSLDKVSDLEAFSENNFTKELHDLDKLINHLVSSSDDWDQKDVENLYLLGHSRGGGISIIKSAEDSRVKKLITWGAPVNFENKIPAELMEYWKSNGVIYVENSRTKQQLPLKYQIAEDFYSNQERINIFSATKKLKIPFLIVHGDQDEVVGLAEGKLIHKACLNSEFLVVKNTDHYFGITFPYNAKSFSDEFKMVLDKSIQFLES